MLMFWIDLFIVLSVEDDTLCKKTMYKIIIQPASKARFYQVILLEQKSFYFFKWWKEVSLMEYEEEAAFAKVTELVEKYDIPSGEVYDWSGDGFNPPQKINKAS